MKSSKQVTLSYFLAGLWLAITFILLTIPGAQFPTHDWLDGLHADKWIHICLFFVLVYLFCRAGCATQQTLVAKKWCVAVITVLALNYGIAMEFVQENWVSNRSFDVWDIVADGIGCFIAAIQQWKKAAKQA
jgi:hypothetical protein